MKKNKILLITFILLIAVFPIGCAARPNNRAQTRLGVDREELGLRRDNNMINRDRLNTNIRNLDDDMIDRDVNDFDMRDNDRMGRNNNLNEDTRKAREIAKKIERLDNVDRAYVLISGNTAIVGIDMDRNVEGQITRDLKDRIEKIVKDTKNDIENVSVTADPDLFTRIRNMAEDIVNGRPISGFAEEFEEILRRINPVTPAR